ncbi:hypothetical protein F2Q68_00019352 [Brassica cretica]|uniref:Myb-like domain-containing protein n=1 Tax=Brassica cretica TaxID=69181 RepID=A0A8S9G1Q6_BRACR|nr:hypothetical protein F2Q68_00019352 [Brassica cretica]
MNIIQHVLKHSEMELGYKCEEEHDEFKRVLRLQAGHKYCLLGRLSSEVGWNHYDTIKELEVKRKEKSQAVYERKRQLIKLRTKAEKVAEEKLGSQLDVLAPINQPVLWTQDETLLLIESHKDKWYAAGRGPLKSSHWEEIAVAVSARSSDVDRSATQCRHKMEKLRKRFRAERQSMGPISIWPFYSQMEELDNSNNPAPPLTRLPPSSSHYEEDDREDERQSKSRSINYIVSRPGTGVAGGLLQWGQKERSKTKRKDGEERRRRRKGARGVTSEIRSFAMVMEKKKMEFAEETVKLRKEMEIKRVKLIQSSQAQLLRSLSAALGSF